MASMRDDHKDKLRSNMMFLMDNMTDVDGVLDYLVEKRIFRESMVEDIRVERTKRAKVRELLSRLPRRGPFAFQTFVQALFEMEEMECAKRLEMDGDSPLPVSDYSPLSPHDDEEPLPDSWPDVSSPLDVQLVLCQDRPYSLSAMMNIIARKKGYRMLSHPRGLCVIINNHDFKMAQDAGKKLDNRTGTDLDCEGLNKLFTDMGFSVDIKRDLKAQGMRKFLRDVAARDYSKMDCLMVFVLSHGGEGVVYGVDGEGMKIQELWHQFDGQHCPALSSKPKVIFLQACQGARGDTGAVAPLTNVHPSDQLDGASLSEDFQRLEVSDAQGEIKDASLTHICLVSATHPGLMSWRKTDSGTWFIQAVIYIFKKYSHSTDLLSMLTKVNHLVNKAETGHGLKQVSKIESSLIQELYFFPGLQMKDGKVEKYKPTD